MIGQDLDMASRCGTSGTCGISPGKEGLDVSGKARPVQG